MWEQKNLVIKQSKTGLGIFAKNGFVASETIFEVKGKLIPCDKEGDLDEKTRANSFRFDRNNYISPEGEMGDFLNHSCSPNAFVSKTGNKLFIIAHKEIKKDKEIAIDYSTIMAADDTWEMDCHCGNKTCRGKIKRFNLLPETIKRKYLALKLIPGYILSS